VTGVVELSHCIRSTDFGVVGMDDRVGIDLGVVAMDNREGTDFGVADCTTSRTVVGVAEPSFCKGAEFVAMALKRTSSRTTTLGRSSEAESSRAAAIAIRFSTNFQEIAVPIFVESIVGNC